MAGNKKKVLMTWVGVAVSAAALYVFLTGIEYAKTWTALKQANYLWLIPGMVSITLSLLTRAYRWRIFLGEKHKNISTFRLFNTLTIGFWGNNLCMFD